MYYQKHIFICENVRAEGERECCGRKGASEIRDYLKTEAKRRCKGKRIRVNKAGCLDRCEEGPVSVVYPDGVWFRLTNKSDVDQFIEGYLLGDDLNSVESLRAGDEHPIVRLEKERAQSQQQ